MEPRDAEPTVTDEPSETLATAQSAPSTSTRVSPTLMSSEGVMLVSGTDALAESAMLQERKPTPCAPSAPAGPASPLGPLSVPFSTHVSAIRCPFLFGR